MTINVEPAERALAFIEAHPEKHQQEVWTCETGACLAGWMAMQAGWEPTFTTEDLRSGEMVRDGVHAFVWDVARDLMGMPFDDRDDEILFCSTNDVDKLKLMVKDLANGEELERVWITTHKGGDVFYERQVD